MDMEQQTGSQLGKVYVKLYIAILLIQLICRVHLQNVGLDESQTGFKIAGRNSNLIYANDTTLMAETKRN